MMMMMMMILTLHAVPNGILGIPHVIAVRREHRLADKTSLIFTKSFYNALLLGKSVQTAYDIAVR